MIVDILFSIAIAGLGPTSAPSPLPEIGHVTSTAFCTALRGRIGHAVQGLLVNDRVIDATGGPLMRMATDQQAGSARVTLDANQLEILLRTGFHNLEIIDQLLATTGTGLASSSDAEAKIKASLQAIAREQSAALNALNGVIDTYAMQDLQARPDLLGAAAGTELTLPHGAGPLSFETVPIPGYIAPISNDLTSKGFVNSPFAIFARNVRAHQIAVGRLEAGASPQIVEAASSCNSQR